MSHWRGPRSPTPPPIKHLIVDNESDDDNNNDENGDLDWFYDTDAGGMVLNFGKYRGRKIHDTSISYLYWCFRNFAYNVRPCNIGSSFEELNVGLSTLFLRRSESTMPDSRNMLRRATVTSLFLSAGSTEERQYASVEIRSGCCGQ